MKKTENKWTQTVPAEVWIEGGSASLLGSTILREATPPLSWQKKKPFINNIDVVKKAKSDHVCHLASAYHKPDIG